MYGVSFGLFNSKPWELMSLLSLALCINEKRNESALSKSRILDSNFMMSNGLRTFVFNFGMRCGLFLITNKDTIIYVCATA